jgi:hypothetical protein
MRWILSLAVTLAFASAARAEIYRCVSANGEVRFTGDASQCPNAAPHAPRAETLQRAERPEAPLASARPGVGASGRRPAAPAREASGAEEAAWREKKAEAESKVRSLESDHERVMAAVRWCNKGDGVLKENARTGLREQVSCRSVDADRARIEGQLEEARAYLESGLEEECRQAGCMPGWIR